MSLKSIFRLGNFPYLNALLLSKDRHKKLKLHPESNNFRVRERIPTFIAFQFAGRNLQLKIAYTLLTH